MNGEASQIEPRRAGRGKRLFRRALPMLLVVAGFAGFLGVVLCGMNRAYDRVYIGTCASNLHTISHSISIYCKDNGGRYPARLEFLVWQADLNWAFLVCTGSTDEAARGATTRQALEDFEKGGHLSYVYLGAGWNQKDVTPAMIVAYDRSMDNHQGKGMNVLFGDGHVEWMDKGKAEHMLSELGKGHNPPR